MFHPSFLSNPTSIPIGSGAGASEPAGNEEVDGGDYSEDEESEGEDDVDDMYTCMACVVCKQTHSKKPNSMILCDGRDCANGLHQKCANPVMTRIPRGSWFCPCCVGAFELLQVVG